MSAGRKHKPTPVGAQPLVERLQRLAAERGTGRPVPDDDTPAEVVAEIRARREQAKRAQHERAIPQRYVGAALADLDQTQQGAQAVAGWLDSPSATLLLTGGVGTGKTHAAYAVLAAAAERGMWVYGCTVFDLLEALRPHATPSPVPRLADQAEIFLFDDLAAERPTDWVVEQLGAIIDSRTSEGKRQIVTTNASYQALVDKLGLRLVSRITSASTQVSFTGDDRRQASA